MSKYKITPSGREVTFGENEIIVSKTDLKGHITYCNEVFVRVSGYSERELIGAPHAVIRHPEMPRAVFKLLWETLQQGREIFAYVNNLSKNGDHYWVLAHVTPSFDGSGAVTGYHSNRRLPQRAAIDKIGALYRTLCQLEQQDSDRKRGMETAYAALVKTLKDQGVAYDEFVLAL